MIEKDYLKIELPNKVIVEFYRNNDFTYDVQVFHKSYYDQRMIFKKLPKFRAEFIYTDTLNELSDLSVYGLIDLFYLYHHRSNKDKISLPLLMNYVHNL